MAREVLLMADVPQLGAEGDVVSVADGYARNYLLPRRLAAPVTDEARARLERLRRERREARQAELEGAQAQAARLEGVSCTIAIKTGEGERLYGSVAAPDIAEALAGEGIELDRHAVRLESPIKELGVFEVPIRLHPEVETTLKVWVVEE